MIYISRNIAAMIAETDAHLAAGAVVQQSYWDQTDNAMGGRGCFVGCLTHGIDPKGLTTRFGFPEPLTRICEGLFERLPGDKSKQLFAAVPRAVAQDGKDLSRAHWAFLGGALRAMPDQEASVQAAIDPVILGIERLANGGEWSWQEALDASDAACNAFRKVYYPAASGIRQVNSAYAADAAFRAAYFVADAGFRATEAAGTARVAAAACDNPCEATQRQAGLLLQLLSDAPVTGTADQPESPALI